MNAGDRTTRNWPAWNHADVRPMAAAATNASATGMGLVLVKAFVDEAGGEIEMLSPPPGKPHGTLVAMRFTAQEPQPPVVEVPRNKPARR